MVGSGDAVDSRQTHFLHQAVLQSPEQPLDAPFRLGTVGRNPFDPQFAQGPSELRESFFSEQLLLECSSAAAMAKNAVLIGVMRQRTSVALQPASERSQVFFRALQSGLNSGTFHAGTKGGSRRYSRESSSVQIRAGSV